MGLICDTVQLTADDSWAMKSTGPIQAQKSDPISLEIEGG